MKKETSLIIDSKQDFFIINTDNNISNSISLGKTADEMFEELGYKIERKEIKNEVEYIDNDEKIIYIDKYRKKILCYNLDSENSEELTLQELQAINKKCQELRWF